MATFLPNSFFYTLTLTTLILLSSLHCQTANIIHDDIHVELDHKPMKQKLSHFRVYWHDIFSGRAPTSITIVKSLPNETFGFGAVAMNDNRLTSGPQLSSKLVGKAQGFYGLASQEEFSLVMAMNFVFMYGKYNGSSITILGRNTVFDQVREMPVVGGSGLFRFAQGYAEARTYAYDSKTGDANVEYNVYVIHY